jgi:hypothetical protein
MNPVTKMQTVPVKGTTKQTPPHEPSDEEIRQRAYEIYLAKGGAPGNEVEDWLQAEREVRSKQ